MSHRRFSARALGLLFLLIALLPASLVAQTTDGDDENIIFQYGRPITVAADDQVDNVVIVNDDATIDGEVSDTLVVVNGTATVRGNVTGNVFVFEGTLVLEESATVNDVTLVNSDLQRAEGATISGTLDEDANYTAVSDGFSVISVAFRIAVGIAILMLSLAMMALFGRPIQRAAETISTQPLASGVAGLGAWGALIMIGIIAFITIIGIPVSLGIFLVLIPFLALMGHIVASYWVGARLGGMLNLNIGPYLLFVIGLVLMQLISAVPWIGGLIVFVITLLGSGALVLYIWRARQQPATEVEGAATV